MSERRRATSFDLTFLAVLLSVAGASCSTSKPSGSAGQPDPGWGGAGGAADAAVEGEAGAADAPSEALDGPPTADGDAADDAAEDVADAPGDASADTAAETTADAPADVVEEDAPPVSCNLDSDCDGKVALTPCQRSYCGAGMVCEIAWLDQAAACDLGDACAITPMCDQGICTAQGYDTTSAGCAIAPGDVFVTEVLGAPVAVTGAVDAKTGAWIEIANGSKKHVILAGLRVVVEQAASFANGGVATTDWLEPGDHVVLAYTDDPVAVGFSGALVCASVVFDPYAEATVHLLGPSWSGVWPADPADVLDSVVVPAAAFVAGASWQAAAPYPADPSQRVWCSVGATPANAYAGAAPSADYGTPGARNGGCP